MRDMFEHLESRTLMSAAHPITAGELSTGANAAIEMNLDGGPDGENAQGGPSDNTPDAPETNNESSVDAESSTAAAARKIRKASMAKVAVTAHKHAHHHAVTHHARHR